MDNSRLEPLRPLFTEAEIRANALKGELPGFLEQSDVVSAVKDGYLNGWQPVFSTTFVSRLDGELHVLTGTRSAEANTTHVNVASTPTIRVSIDEVDPLVYGRVPFYLAGKIDPSRPYVSNSLAPAARGIPDSTSILSGRVGYIMALKLGLAEALENAQAPIGRASLARCVIGFSYLEDNERDEPLYEPLIMLGAIVGLNVQVAEQVPDRTSSYGHLGWTPIDSYVRGIATKNLLDVIPAAQPRDELEVCIRGLCNATSSSILATPDEIQYHMTEGWVINPI